MKTYRCVVRRTTEPTPQTIHVAALDCRAAASAAVDALTIGDNDWIEVWHEGEMVLKRRLSNLYPAPRVTTSAVTGGKPLR